MGGDTLVIEADATQLQQVMMNLLANARDAVQDKQDGLIKVTLKTYEADDAFLIKHQLSYTKYFAHLIVSDNGSGISEEEKQHIFEPFYTTKGVGEGTGLGLAMVYGSIQTHHGVIDIESTAGVGSSFHLYFPLIEVEATPVKNVYEDFLHGRGETILIVDDNEVVREITVEALGDGGYQIYQACNGAETLKLLEIGEQHIDLIILDIVMPGMSGGEVARKIRLIHPEMPIIFMTGYDKEQVFPRQKNLAHCQVITKPFQFSALSQTMRELLDDSMHLKV